MADDEAGTAAAEDERASSEAGAEAASSDASGEGAPAAEQDDGASDADAPDAGGPLIFLDPRLEEAEVEALQGALGRPVRVCSEADLEGELPQAAALVVPFALPTHSGLELVEAIRLRERSSDPPGRAVPIIVASKAPTRERVLLALGAGANSFAFQPYDADELRARLAAVEAAPEEGRAG